jgi:hypothetical protein
MAGLGGGDGQTKLAERGFVPSYLSGDALIGRRLVLGAAESPLRAGCLECTHTTIARHQALKVSFFYTRSQPRQHCLDMSRMPVSISDCSHGSTNEGQIALFSTRLVFHSNPIHLSATHFST